MTGARFAAEMRDRSRAFVIDFADQNADHSYAWQTVSQSLMPDERGFIRGALRPDV